MNFKMNILGTLLVVAIFALLVWLYVAHRGVLFGLIVLTTVVLTVVASIAAGIAVEGFWQGLGVGIGVFVGCALGGAMGISHLGAVMEIDKIGRH
ncbi:hypothetical protein ACQ7HM_05210 [Williamsia sp. MIQD14]|uniref:hypothetical protein n=1 Tax=Williamsia sp. MIQD14 TaxID=3425703 RepID=UPI003DA1AA1A